MVSLVLVGCGKAKQEDDRPYRAYELYTSNYFAMKRRYAQRVGEHWYILSALHGVLNPWHPTRPYEVTLSDYPREDAVWGPVTLDQWVDRVRNDLGTAVFGPWEHQDHDAYDEVVLLAGQSYIDPIRGVLDDLSEKYDFEIREPFQDTSGIGEQMAWLRKNTPVSREVA